MKGTLVVLVLLQLAALNEAKTKLKPSGLVSVKPWFKHRIPTCPRNPRFEEFKKALRLAVEHNRPKRTLSFPMNCVDAAVIETDKGPENHFGIYECCDKCRTSFDQCILSGEFDMICASRAYKCLCECREKELRSGSKFRKLIRNKVCLKSTCIFNQKSCCVEDVCLKLKIPKRVSLVKY